jgi:hypothetical protein
MAMTDKPAKIEHSPMQTPTVFCTDDSVFYGDYTDKVWKLWKQDFRQMSKYCKTMRILDASGRRFVVDRLEEVRPTSPFAAFFREKYWMTWVTPIIVSEKQLTLEEFKKELMRAVKAKQRYDRGSRIVERTMEKLPRAETYLEVIESLPKPL